MTTDLPAAGPGVDWTGKIDARLYPPAAKRADSSHIEGIGVERVTGIEPA